MNEVLGILMVLVAGLWVALPFFQSAADEDEPLPEPISRTDILERQKREAYAAIKEAEFDHQMGKLTDVDFGVLQEKYRAQALEAIAALQGGTEAPATSAARMPTRLSFCATCGRKLPSKANFCPGCGRAIKADRESLRAQAERPLAGAALQTG